LARRWIDILLEIYFAGRRLWHLRSNPGETADLTAFAKATAVKKVGTIPGPT